MATLNFNAQTVQPSQPLEPIPSGWYTCQITESVIEPTKSGNGHFLKLTLKVLEGEYSGRTVFDRLNIDNPNETAVTIAYETLSAICHATGVIQVSDSSELHGRPMNVKVKLTPANDRYDAGNEVKGYAPLQQQAAAPMQQPAQGQPVMQQPAPAMQQPAAPVQQQVPPQQPAPAQQAAPAMQFNAPPQQAAPRPPWAQQ